MSDFFSLMEARPMNDNARVAAVIFSAPPTPDAEEMAAKRATYRERAERQRIEREEARAAFLPIARERFPVWANSVILAEYQVSESDSMSDYYNARTVRTVIIGFSRHTRDLFPEMRKAAATFEDTAYLATAPDSAEHREKYSMGGGYYLSTGGRYSTGWRIVKRTARNVEELPTAEFAPEPVAPVAAAVVASGAGMRVEEHFHTKGGFAMWIAISAERVEREEFERLRDAAKAAGGWYSRAWGKVPGGYAFKSEAAALAFAGAPGTSSDTVASATAPDVASAPVAAPALAGKLRDMADALQSAIDDKFRDRVRNTPKQQRQAAEARLDGAHLERAQTAMRALADMHDAGTVPAALVGVRSKSAIVDLARSTIKRDGGYYDAGVCTGTPYDTTPAALALWELLRPNPEKAAAEELRRKIDSLRFANIPGYFPTPAALVARMIDEAGLPEGAQVLEPSAGSGAIADALRDAGHNVVCIERHSTLCDILRGKGHNVIQSDFCEIGDLPQFDAVVMNPPFERGQDLEHIARAWCNVKPGGALVAIMGAGVTFRQDRKYAEFRGFVEANGGTLEDIPAGAFKESGTGVASVLLTMTKEA